MLTPSRRLNAAGVHASIRSVEPFNSFDALFSCLRELGREGRSGSPYWRQAVETATLARQSDCGDALISAALLHQVGAMFWFTSAAAGSDVSPSALAHFGADLLSDLYALRITEPIRMQASAQRYMAASKSLALRELVHTRKLDGWPMVEPMTEPERECFAAMPFASDAIRLCRWSLAATGAADLDYSARSLRRIAARSIDNHGFGWESSRRELETGVAETVP